MLLPPSVKGAALIGFLYVLPKGLSWLATRSARDETVVDVARNRFAAAQEKTATFMGQKRWLFTTEVILDNLWISVLALCLINPPIAAAVPTASQLLNGFVFCSAGSTLAWITRYYGAQALHPYHRTLAIRLAPRELSTRL